MKKFTVLEKAKLNITLDVFSKEGELHPIKSFCVPINLADKITVKKRKDGAITLKEKGIKTGLPFLQNNAVKAAELFIKEKGAPGVDIIIDKKIPLSSGLGGSSADVSGVIKCMEKLFNKNATDLLPRLSSDASFTYYSLPALISNKGEKVEPLSLDFHGYALIITDKAPILSKDCYKKFDEMQTETSPITDKVIKLIKQKKPFYSEMKNDLQAPALKILPSLSEKLIDLEKAGALKSQLSGSGSSVFGLFEDKKKLINAEKQLKKKYKNNLIKVKY